MGKSPYFRICQVGHFLVWPQEMIHYERPIEISFATKRYSRPLNKWTYQLVNAPLQMKLSTFSWRCFSFVMNPMVQRQQVGLAANFGQDYQCMRQAGADLISRQFGHLIVTTVIWTPKQVHLASFEVRTDNNDHHHHHRHYHHLPSNKWVLRLDALEDETFVSKHVMICWPPWWLDADVHYINLSHLTWNLPSAEKSVRSSVISLFGPNTFAVPVFPRGKFFGTVGLHCAAYPWRRALPY